MAAVRYRLRAELRSGWRPLVGLAVLIGLTAGAVIGASVGARRTDTAYSRFLDHVHAADAFLIDDGLDPRFHVPVDAVRRLPEVKESVRAAFGYIGDLGWIAGADDRLGTSVNGLKILKGRRPRPERAEEVAVGFVAAEQHGYEIGDTFPFYDEQEAEEARRLGETLPPPVNFRVVGIEASPSEFPPLLGTGTVAFHMTPAFYRLVQPTPDSLLVRLTRGQADLGSFTRGVRRLGLPFVQSQADFSAATQRSFHLQALALWLLAGLTGAVGALVLSQTLARQAVLDSGEHTTLAALGMTSTQRLGLGVMRTAVAALVGAGLAVAVAIAVSPLTPIGLARTAEPHSGIATDGAVLALGAAASVVVVVALALVPTWRVARRRGVEEDDIAETPSRAATAVARVGGPAAMVMGIRMALERGRGRTAVPVATTLAGATVGIAALTAALTFGTSLDRLISTPRLYGRTWDTAATNYGSGPSYAGHLEAPLTSEAAIDAFSLGSDPPLSVEGRQVGGLALDPTPTGVLPPILEGRAPTRANEIALGTRTLRAIRAHVGEDVSVAILEGRARMRIVGITVLPAPFEARLGHGGLLTLGGLRRIVGDDFPALTRPGILLARFKPGVSARERSRVLGALQRQFEALPADPEQPAVFARLPADKPSDIVNFGRVQSMPFVLGGVLALIAVATLAHMLVSALRRRRRDVAVLKALGFVRRQVMAAVAWQTTTIAMVALVVGVPLGVSIGRWVWILLAHQLGVVAQPVTHVRPLLLIILATVLLANSIAAVPARNAARTRPAMVLRTE